MVVCALKIIAGLLSLSQATAAVGVLFLVQNSKLKLDIFFYTTTY